MLGSRHSEENLLKISQVQRGKSKPKSKSSISSAPINISQETINKLQQRVNGVIIKVFDKDGNLINKFPTMSEAAKFYTFRC